MDNILGRANGMRKGIEYISEGENEYVDGTMNYYVLDQQTEKYDLDIKFLVQMFINQLVLKIHMLKS